MHKLSCYLSFYVTCTLRVIRQNVEIARTYVYLRSRDLVYLLVELRDMGMSVDLSLWVAEGFFFFSSSSIFVYFYIFTLFIDLKFPIAV